MKRILCLIDNLGSGGAQRQLTNLSVILKNEGYDVQFLTYGDDDFYISVLNENRIPVHAAKSNGKLKRILAVRKTIKCLSPDTVISFLDTPNFIACVAKMFGGKWKLITSERSAKEERFPKFRNKVYNWFERYSDAKVCNSQNARSMWEHYYPQYRKKYTVIYNPVMIDNPVEEQHFYLSDGKLHMVVAASYQKLKGPLMLIEAVQQLDASQKIKLIIDWYGKAEVTTGDTAIYDEAVRMIERYQLGDVIVLHGEIRNIYPIMSRADVIGLFSTVEGLPNAICEGMTLGKPIMMTKVSDCAVLVNGNGVICEATVEGIRNGLGELLTYDKQKLTEMGSVSKQKAEQLFSVESIKKQWLSVIY